MAKFNQAFKVQCVKKVLSKHSAQTVKDIANHLGVGYSTLQKWIRLAKNNELESPQDWNKAERLDALMHCHGLNDEPISSYCRENGIYPHHLKAWKTEFITDKQGVETLSRQEQKSSGKQTSACRKSLIVRIKRYQKQRPCWCCQKSAKRSGRKRRSINCLPGSQEVLCPDW